MRASIVKDGKDQSRKNFEGLLGTILAVPKVVLDAALGKENRDSETAVLQSDTRH